VRSTGQLCHHWGSFLSRISPPADNDSQPPAERPATGFAVQNPPIVLTCLIPTAAAISWQCIAACAQQPGKLPTIRFLGAATASVWDAWTSAFEQRLRELGWTEGHTLAIEYRWAEGRPEPPGGYPALQAGDVQADIGRSYGVSQATTSRLATPSPFEAGPAAARARRSARLAAAARATARAILLPSSAVMKLMPVTLPPGRLKLVTRPSATGSPPVPNTIGMIVVAAFARAPLAWRAA
jgi:hypothetical protein